MCKAVAFGYFEALLHSSDPNRALAEVARLKSLNNLLDSVGYDRIIYEDFVDETLTMLQLIPTLPTQDDGTALLEALDRPGVWDAIIAHFRVGIGAILVAPSILTYSVSLSPVPG